MTQQWRRTHLLTLTLCSVMLWQAVGQAACQTTAPVTQPDLALAQDARLDRKITVEQTGIALKDLLCQVSGDELTLVASRLCADQKLQLQLNQRPLRALMTSLAALLGGNWQPTEDKKGYLFSQTDNTMLRRRRWWSLFQGEHERALAALPDMALRAMRTPLGKTEYSSGETDPQVAAEAVERARAENEASHNFFAQLPPALQERAAQSIAIDPFYRKEIQADTGFPLDGAFVVAIQDLPAAEQEIAQRSIRVPPGQSVPEIAYVRLRNGGLCIRAAFLNADGKSIGELSSSADHSNGSPALKLDQRALAEQVRRMGRLAPPEWKELAAYQNTAVWKNDPSPDFPPDQFFQFKDHYVTVNSRPIPPRREEVLSWLASKAKLEFVSDYYSHPYEPFTPDTAHERPLKSELDFRAAEQDMSWKQQADSIYLFRNNRWYRDDALEVPNDQLRRWMIAMAELDRDRPHYAYREAPAPATYAQRVLDLQAEMVSTLTPWQIANGLQWATYRRQDGEPALPFDKDGPAMLRQVTPRGIVQSDTNGAPSHVQYPFGFLADTVRDNRNTLRFYAALGAEQRSQLVSGLLPYASLGQAAQQSAAFLEPLLPVALRRTALADQPLLLGLKTKFDTEG